MDLGKLQKALCHQRRGDDRLSSGTVHLRKAVSIYLRRPRVYGRSAAGADVPHRLLDSGGVPRNLRQHSGGDRRGEV